MPDGARPPATSPGAGRRAATIDKELGEIAVWQAMTLPARLRWQLAGRYRASGEFEAAAALLDAIAAQSGESATLLEEQARLAFARGRTDEAIDLLARRAEDWPSASSLAALARLHLSAGHLEQAMALMETLLDQSPDLQIVRTFAADVMRASGQLSAARAHLEQILAARPDHPGILLQLAEISLDANDAAGAEALFANALDAGDNLTSGQLHTAAGIATALDRPEQATELTRRAEELEATRDRAFIEAIRRALPEIEDESAPVSGFPTPSLEAGQAPVPAPTQADAASPSVGASPRACPSSADGAKNPDVAGKGRGQPQGAAPTDDGDEPAPVTPSVIEAPPLPPEVEATLRRDFGHAALRPGQAAVIGQVLAGHDTLAIMPTGAGKSLTFQLPAMLLPQATLVISPLIALMKDQIESLPPAVREQTTLINSTLSLDEMRRRLRAIEAGEYRLIYVAPERLRQTSFLQALRARGVSLVVVDEAHCITHWGHDFRPDYLTIPHALTALDNPAVLAITATATPAMAKAIGAGLGRDLARVQISLFRPNLFYEVHQLPNREAKVAKLIELCRQIRGTGIVYVSSRRDAETLAGLLRQRGVNAVPYHAGLEPEIRAGNQERFMQGQVRVIVATVAFGMGVNKADVRFIIHLNPPRSLEAYAQESGRAGRDGKPARCVLLIAPADRATLLRLAHRDEADLDTLRLVYSRVKRQAVDRWALVEPNQLLPLNGPDATGNADPRVTLGILEQAGLLRRHPDAAVSKSIWWEQPSPPNPLPPSQASLHRREESLPILGEGGSRTLSQNWERVAPQAPGEGVWSRFVEWAGLDAATAGTQIRTAEACAALDLSPVALDALLAAQPGVLVNDGPRLACVELLPVGDDMARRMNDLLLQLRQTAERRIAQVIGYASGRSCRHLLLARHLGETLAPCRTACDNCVNARADDQGKQAQPGKTTTAPVTAGAGSQRSRSTLSASDALATLQAMRTLPFPLGKTGLAKLLAGSVESSVRADRSSSFGALAELSKSRIGTLIDRLISDGFLEQYLDRDYKLLRLTPRGRTATEDDLADYGPEIGPDPTKDELDPAQRVLFDRLRHWRQETASEAGVPSYVVAHDKMLLAVAAAHPASLAELGQISGFGPRRVEEYGDAVLAVVRAASESDGDS